MSKDAWVLSLTPGAQQRVLGDRAAPLSTLAQAGKHHHLSQCGQPAAGAWVTCQLGFVLRSLSLPLSFPLFIPLCFSSLPHPSLPSSFFLFFVVLSPSHLPNLSFLLSCSLWRSSSILTSVPSSSRALRCYVDIATLRLHTSHRQPCSVCPDTHRHPKSRVQPQFSITINCIPTSLQTQVCLISQ